MKKLLTLLLSLLMILSLVGCNSKKEETSTHTHQYEVDEDGIWKCKEDNDILSNTDKPYVALLENNEPKDIILLDSITSKKTNLGNGVIYKEDNTIFYNGNNAQSIIIKTEIDNKNKKDKAVINAPNDTVYHYGSSSTISLDAVATESFHEYGKVDLITLTKARIVLETLSNVKEIYLDINNPSYNYESAIIAVKEDVEIPNLSRDAVDLKEGEVKTLAVIQQLKDETKQDNTIETKTEEENFVKIENISKSDNDLIIQAFLSPSADTKDNTKLETKQTSTLTLEEAKEGSNHPASKNTFVSKTEKIEGKVLPKEEKKQDLYEQYVKPIVTPVAPIVTPDKKETKKDDPIPTPIPTPSITKYTVTFDMQGYGTQVPSQTIKKGKKVSEPTPKPTATGLIFKGWYKESTCDTEWNFSADIVTSDTALYAKWARTIGYVIGDSFPGNDNAWTNGQNCFCYYHPWAYAMMPCITFYNSEVSNSSVTMPCYGEVAETEGGYIYEDSVYNITLTFNMNGDNLESIVLDADEAALDPIKALAGAYTPPTPPAPVDKSSYTMKSGTTWFNTFTKPTNKDQITDIIFTNSAPSGSVEDVDLTAETTGNVKGYIVPNGENYKIYIVGDYIFGNENCAGIFAGFSNLASIAFGNFDTSNVTNMQMMFFNSSGLTSLDLSKFDTSKVTNMVSMFSGCSGLTTLDLSKFDTSNVTSMSSIFNGCSGLESLDLGKFDIGKVTNMSNMFHNCVKLASVKIEEANDTIKGQLGDAWTYASGAYTAQAPAAPLTIKFILGTASEDFPTSSDQNTAPEGAWKTTEGKSCYTHSNYLVFNNNSSVLERDYNNAVKKTNEGYIYTNSDADTNPITFNMTDGKLTSITIKGPEDNDAYNGTYALAPVSVTSVSLDKTELELTVGDADVKLTATVLPDNAINKNVTWSSNNTDVATVDNAGNVHAVVAGEATITVTTVDGNKTNTCAVNVTAPATYTVTFDMQGHGTKIDPLTYITSGSKIKEPTTPTADAFVFGGWFKDADCKQGWNFDADTVTANTTLYAKWSAITVADILSTVEGGFPTTYETGWITSNGHKCYVSEGLIRFEHKLHERTATDNITWEVEKTDNGYSLAGGTYLFEMRDGKLISITLELPSNDSNKLLNGKYSPAPTLTMFAPKTLSKLVNEDLLINKEENELVTEDVESEIEEHEEDVSENEIQSSEELVEEITPIVELNEEEPSLESEEKKEEQVQSEQVETEESEPIIEEQIPEIPMVEVEKKESGEEENILESEDKQEEVVEPSEVEPEEIVEEIETGTQETLD